MAAGRKKGDHDARRIQIAEATCRVILRMGVERAGIAEIAREMGCSTGVVMHYHASKAELLLFAKNLLFDTVYDRVAQARQGPAVIDTLVAMGREMLPLDAAAVERWRVLTAFNGLAIGNPDLMKLQAKRDLRFTKIFSDAIRELQQAGVLSSKVDALTEGRGIAALADGISGEVVMSPGTWKARQSLAFMERHIRMLAAVP